MTFKSFSTFFFHLFLDRGEGRETESERNINVRERNVCWLPLAHPLLGTWPATQTCALTGNQTGNLSVQRPVLNPLSHTSLFTHQGKSFSTLNKSRISTEAHQTEGETNINFTTQLQSGYESITFIKSEESMQTSGYVFKTLTNEKVILFAIIFYRYKANPRSS